MSLLKRIEQGQGGQPTQSASGESDAKFRLSSLQPRNITAPRPGAQKDQLMELKIRVQNRLLSEMDPTTDITKTNDVRNTILELFEQVLAEENIPLARPEKHRLF